MTALFELGGVVKRYGAAHPGGNGAGRAALDIPALAIEEGRAVRVIGPNGAGKTTLLELLAGLCPQTEGTLVFRGRGLPPAPAAARRMAGEVTLVAQVPYLFRGTVLDNVEYGPRSLGLPGRACRERALAALDGLGIGGLAGKTAGALSRGELRMAALARAFALDAGALILDEPLSDLDAGNSRRVLAALEGLKRRGRTLVASGHVAEALDGLADSSLFLENGRLRPA